VAELITCPSGLSGTLRGMKVREEKILVDRKLANSGGQLDELLRACWEDTVDPGPYTFEGPRPDWSAVLQGDRFYVLLQLRALTYGPEYSFAVTCREQRCRSRIDWELDLCDLPVRPLTDGSRTLFLNGNRFPTVLPDAGKEVFFKLMTGADERRLPALRRKAGDRLLSATLVYRLVEIEGVEPKDKRRFVEELTLADARHLGEEFQRVDCGVETSIDIECPHCFAVQAVDLPFDQDFFLPTKGRFSQTSTSTGGAKASSSSSGTSTEDQD
jgi:hypothetical protein